MRRQTQGSSLPNRADNGSRSQNHAFSPREICRANVFARIWLHPVER
ncbi:hypothetical protein ACFPRL_05780 [Pseudoclavibacter helvolus]